MMLVTLQEASDHLRRDTSDDDNDLTLKILGASGAIMNYLDGAFLYEAERDSSGRIILDSSGSKIPVRDNNGIPQIRWEVKTATLLMVGELYKSREGEHTGEVGGVLGIPSGYGYLPRFVVALLYPLRVPVVA